MPKLLVRSVSDRFLMKCTWVPASAPPNAMRKMAAAPPSSLPMSLAMPDFCQDYRDGHDHGGHDGPGHDRAEGNPEQAPVIASEVSLPPRSQPVPR